MLVVLQVAALLLVSIAMALSLAHALELPGKLRLDRDTYVVVQAIYYPGFTVGGMVGEAGGLAALIALVLVTPFGGAAFWWTVAALVLLLAAHLTYWLVTHPVNRFWVKDIDMAAPGARFFALFSHGAAGDWKTQRNVWEYSHVARAALAMLALCAIAIALAA